MRNTLLTLALAANVSLATAASFSFGDNFDPEATWTHTVISDDSGGNATHSYSNPLSGGNPIGFQQTKLQNSVGTSQQSVAHLLSGAQWDPSTQGAIQSVTISFDYMRLQAAGASQFTALLRQGGNYFRPVTFANGTTSWQSVSTGTVADVFFCGYFGCSGDPDFSASGGLIEFGYATYQNNYFTSPASLPVEVSVGVDNYNLTLVSDAPEPMSFLLIGAGLGVLGMVRRRN